MLDRLELSRRREKFNMIYKELMLISDQQQRIPFHEALKVLCYYMIDVEKSLQIGEELFERKQRMERVKEAIAREKIRGLFTTIIKRRQFRSRRELVGFDSNPSTSPSLLAAGFALTNELQLIYPKLWCSRRWIKKLLKLNFPSFCHP